MVHAAVVLDRRMVPQHHVLYFSACLGNNADKWSASVATETNQLDWKAKVEKYPWRKYNP